MIEDRDQRIEDRGQRLETRDQRIEDREQRIEIKVSSHYQLLPGHWSCPVHGIKSGFLVNTITSMVFCFFKFHLAFLAYVWVCVWGGTFFPVLTTKNSTSFTFRYRKTLKTLCFYCIFMVFVKQWLDKGINPKYCLKVFFI